MEGTGEVALEDIPPVQIWNEVCKQFYVYSACHSGVIWLSDLTVSDPLFLVAWYGTQNTTWKQVSGEF